MNDVATGLIGWPVEHSLSPAIHNYWRKQHGIGGSYELFPTPPEKLGEAVAALKARGVRGFNVTVPHKRAIIPLLGPLDMRARTIGAVNTVIHEDGRLFATNTDAFGFLTGLRESMGELAPYMERAVVLGAGGAARAILAALKEAGAKEIVIANRTLEHAEKLAAEFGATAARGSSATRCSPARRCWSTRPASACSTSRSWSFPSPALRRRRWSPISSMRRFRRSSCAPQEHAETLSSTG
ncbi:MAG: shikimate dehydrogenase [Alphaproteobacteria bacterium]